jgi:hypothetical protein
MCPYGRLEGHRVGSFGGSGAVDVSTVVDIEYVDGVVGVLDAISDAVLTAARSPLAVERRAQRCTDAVRVVSQRAEQELDAGGRR